MNAIGTSSPIDLPRSVAMRAARLHCVGDRAERVRRGVMRTRRDPKRCRRYRRIARVRAVRRATRDRRACDELDDDLTRADEGLPQPGRACLAHTSHLEARGDERVDRAGIIGRTTRRHDRSRSPGSGGRSAVRPTRRRRAHSRGRQPVDLTRGGRHAGQGPSGDARAGLADSYADRPDRDDLLTVAITLYREPGRAPRLRRTRGVEADDRRAHDPTSSA